MNLNLQILSIPDKLEKDEIVKSMKHLKLSDIEEGYTMDTIVSCQGKDSTKVIPSNSIVLVAWCTFPLTRGAFLKCAIAKTNFEKNEICQGFEALARAQSLLKRKPSLEQMTLLSQGNLVAKMVMTLWSMQKKKVNGGVKDLGVSLDLCKRLMSVEEAESLVKNMAKCEEALVEEAAELMDASHQKNPNYYSTYTIRYLLKRQDDGSWRFCEGDVQTTS
ncbi:hypothetical protein L2E82_11272 [Cichorium intybus]|uniref:Uncharacterized protein n=1 Tax=Cichorium intybus TaxID=13427 RepID=A0ACB9GDX8_CICIN|nr:hypothetical protein L2E82_11272 [Cichorium intybus]